jgi:hypothetical protein
MAMGWSPTGGEDLDAAVAGRYRLPLAEFVAAPDRLVRPAEGRIQPYFVVPAVRSRIGQRRRTDTRVRPRPSIGKPLDHYTGVGRVS